MVIRMDAFTQPPEVDGASVMDGSGTPTDAAMTRAVERLVRAERRSTAELLSELRRDFPNSPLAVRVRALEALRRR
jgi:hypothetical protein